jgi:hypothetical protein
MVFIDLVGSAPHVEVTDVREKACAARLLIWASLASDPGMSE